MEDALSHPAPTVSEKAISATASIFGLAADDAKSLGSERDLAFLLLSDKQPVAVMKVSNAMQDVALLDLEAGAACHIAAVDSGLPVALPMKAPGSSNHLRYQYKSDSGELYWIRCYPVMPGAVRELEDGKLSDTLLRNWGSASARVGRALRSYGDPLAHTKVTPWDSQHALLMRPLLVHVTEERGMRALCAGILAYFEVQVKPRLPNLRHQVVHGDLNLGNVLVTDEDISGIIDFGDMSFTALAVDIASMLCAIGAAHVSEFVSAGGEGTVGGELMRMGRVLLDGYQSITPLEEKELAMLPDLWMVRTCIEIVCSAWRVGTGLETAERCGPEQPFFEAAMRTLHSLGPAKRCLGLLSAIDVAGDAAANGAPVSTTELAARREQCIGPASEPLSYGSEPLRVSHASGCWITDTSGRKFLDCYNNVPCVGHAHPRVAQAIARQAAKANVNMRYLHPLAITLAERIKETLPGELDTVFFCNSGSEANDLAWRMATSITGQRGALCTTHAYHGISEATIALSPETAAECGHLPAHVERWHPPDAYRGTGNDDISFKAAIERLAGKGLRPAMCILDGVMQSDGVLQLEPEYVQSIAKVCKESGALWCADEVQGGHGRVGSHLWSFQKFGIVPDFVTMGKPMGNGHPVACCVTSRAIAAKFVAKEGVWFSTFGGNPVSCAAAHAVLDVLQDESVLPRVERAGAALRTNVREALLKYDCVGEVRGRGLAIGIEIVTDSVTKAPDAKLCTAIKDGLKKRGVLVGTTGPHCNVIKVRPPLAFSEKEVPIFVDAIVGAVEEACSAPSARI